MKAEEDNPAGKSGNPAILVKNLARHFGKKNTKVQALHDISLSVAKGELFGIIGPDGAGKTTLFRILATLLLADSGLAKVEGLDVVRDYREIRNRVGYMPGRFSLYQDLTVQENLEFFATIFNANISENYDLVRDIYSQIEPFRDRRAGKLSGGMKQKLALSCALIHRPSVLFLDEPTTGVDAVSRKEFWEMLQKLREKGISILVSTPYMDEASLCDRVALIQAGRILSVNTPRGILEEFSKPLLAVKAEKMYPLLKQLKSDSDIESAYPFGEYHHVVLRPGAAGALAGSYRDNFPGLEVSEAKPTVEDCFMALMSVEEDE